MTDASSPKKSVSLGKNTGSAALAPRPPSALYAVYAMAGAAVFGVIASVIIYGQRSYLYKNAKKAADTANDKAKAADKKTPAELVHQAHQSVAATQKSVIIAIVITLLVLAFLGNGVYRGRHWSRMATVIVWFLLSFTGSVVGLYSILQVAGDVPLAYKIPSLLGGLLMLVAVVLTNLAPSVRWFALSKPAAPPGRRQRGGLFGGPRPAPRAAGPSLTKSSDNRAARAEDGKAAAAIAAERARAKKRAATTSVAKGADLARTRAKAASKSRRTES